MFRGNQIGHLVSKVEIRIVNIQHWAATERLRLIAPVLQYFREAPDTLMITALLLEFYCSSHCTPGESPQKSPGKELQVTSTWNCCNIHTHIPCFCLMWFYSGIFWGMYASDILPMCESAWHVATICGQTCVNYTHQNPTVTTSPNYCTLRLVWSSLCSFQYLHIRKPSKS